MNSGVDSQSWSAPADAPRHNVLLMSALAWMAGILLACAVSGWWLIITATCLIASSILIRIRSRKWPGFIIWLALILVSASWADLHRNHVSRYHISRHLSEKPALARVTGTIDGAISNAPQQRGEFGRRFGWQGWACLFVLDLNAIEADGRMQPARGKVIVKIKKPEHRLKPGMHIRATGWLAAIRKPMNPGEFDFKSMLADKGIEGRLTLANRHNFQALDDSSLWTRWAGWRHDASNKVANSLRLGMQSDTERLAFLDAILLGRRSRDIDGLTDSFRRVGLAHLLSISGAHLAILLGLTWLGARLLFSKPPHAVLVVAVVLTLYMIVVPMRVPIIRAGLMAGLFCIGSLTSRRIRSISVLALACLLVLIWRPQDLFNAGFQLSFGVVAALLLFTERVSHRLWAPPVIDQPMTGPRPTQWVRFAADYVAVSIVAFSVAAPMVAYHYQLISPLNVLLTIMALPVVTAVLGVGYLKLLIGLVLPSAGALLAGPLQWLADALVGLVEHATTWPAATVQLNQSPSLLWVIGTLATIAALLAGWFTKRPWSLGAVTAIIILWLVLPLHRTTAQLFTPNPNDAALLQLNMFAVGDGSCYLIRASRQTPHDRPHVTMFDCGSQAYTDMGIRSIVPALQSMGIHRIDTLILSHADLDHFCGALDVIDHVQVDTVLVPPHLLRKARKEPGSAVAYLINQLGKRDIHPRAISQGTSLNWGKVRAKVLWPPADLTPKSDNDTSLVIGIDSDSGSASPPDSRPRFHFLLAGDIATQAMTGLLQSEQSLSASVMELPHHGSFAQQSPEFLQAVAPRLVLQSCGQARLENDKWAGLLEKNSITRLRSAQLGMTQLLIDEHGHIKYHSIGNPQWTKLETDFSHTPPENTAADHSTNAP